MPVNVVRSRGICPSPLITKRTDPRIREASVARRSLQVRTRLFRRQSLQKLTDLCSISLPDHLVCEDRLVSGLGEGTDRNQRKGPSDLNELIFFLGARSLRR